MAFKMVSHLSDLDWKVKVNVPVNGGKTETFEFTAKFKILKKSEFDKALKDAKEDADFFSHFLLDWEGLLDDNDKPVKFTKKALKELCEYPFAKSSIMRAYQEAAAGIEIKN